MNHWHIGKVLVCLSLSGWGGFRSRSHRELNVKLLSASAALDQSRLASKTHAHSPSGHFRCSRIRKITQAHWEWFAACGVGPCVLRAKGFFLSSPILLFYLLGNPIPIKKGKQPPISQKKCACRAGRMPTRQKRHKTVKLIPIIFVQWSMKMRNLHFVPQ